MNRHIKRGAWLTLVIGMTGMVLGWHPAAAEWKYESTEPQSNPNLK